MVLEKFLNFCVEFVVLLYEFYPFQYQSFQVVVVHS